MAGEMERSFESGMKWEENIDSNNGACFHHSVRSEFILLIRLLIEL